MTHRDPPRKRGYFNLGKHWPYVIVLMLLAHASLMIGTIVYVSSKRDTYVDPQYYAKSIDWDNQREMKEAAENEGWQITLRTGFIANDPNQRSVELQLLDINGNPIDDALIELVCYHPAQLADRLDAVMTHDQAGTYSRTLPIDRPGIWLAELTIQRQGVRALLTKDLDVISVPHAVTP